jgi:hypothetical protein
MDEVLQVDLTVLNFIAGSLVPLAVGLVTKLNASSRLKAVVNLLLSVVTGVLTAMIAASGETTLALLASSAVTAYLSSGVSYNNLWKPTQVASAVQDVAPGVGLGSN